MSVAYDTGAVSGHSARTARAYRRAVRHSARVRLLKIAFPVLSLVVVLGFVFSSMTTRSLPDNMSVERTAVSNGMIVMDNPELTGEASDGKTFTVNAVQALQSIASPNVITLKSIGAELPVGEDETARVEAESGVYDRAQETLKLDQPFSVTASNGLEVEMQSASFDIAGGSMHSEAPLEIRNGNTSLVAQSVEMRDNGAIIRFEGDVRMTIDPSTLRNSPEDD